MGRHHARVFATLPSVSVTAIVDMDSEAARALASKVGARACTAPEAMATSDAVIIATPMDSHASLVARALAAGLHVLVEKPICTSVLPHRDMARTARLRGLVLAVGHSERFNPAIRALAAASRTDPIVRLSTVRFATQQRAPRASIMLNLAVHDLDLARHLSGAAVELSLASGNSDRVSLTTTRFGLPFGAHQVSQNASERTRTLVATTARGKLYEADLLRGTLMVDARFLSVPDDEPLVVQARAFVQAIADDDLDLASSPLANAQDALAAVSLALCADQMVADSAKQRSRALP